MLVHKYAMKNLFFISSTKTQQKNTVFLICFSNGSEHRSQDDDYHTNAILKILNRDLRLFTIALGAVVVFQRGWLYNMCVCTHIQWKNVLRMFYQNAIEKH